MAATIKSFLSPPIDSGTMDEIKRTIKEILETFTKNYIKYYAINLIKKVIADAQADPGPDWKLEERPPGETKYMEGYVMKRAGFAKKSMQKRYFVVRPDYMIDYYLTEEEAKKEKGKKKGTIALCGYWVHEDANAGIIQRLFKLAEKFGMDTSAIPKPTEYPQYTMELYHDRRKSYYIQHEDKEQFDQWVRQMRTCCWLVRGFKNKDPVHIKSFEEALRKTRWKCGRWGWWSCAGTEEEMLTDLISDQIDWDIMGKVYAKFVGPWQIRHALQKQVLKVIDKLVIAAVTPAWAGMAKAVETLRPKIEPTLKDTIGPLAELQMKLMDQIKSACMSVITPAMDEHVVPHLAKILEIIQSPMTDAFNKSYELWDSEVMDKYKAEDDVEANKREMRNMNWFPWSWKMYDTTKLLDELYEPLWALNLIFPEITPWYLIWHGHDHLKKKMDNAIYTFQKRLNESAEKGEGSITSLVPKTREGVIADYKHDGELQRILYYRHILKSIVMPPVTKVLYPLVEKLLSPISDAIPDALSQFVDINGMFEHLIGGIIDDTIDNALKKSVK